MGDETMRVLIVEDEAPARRLFASALERAGHNVLQAGSAEEALIVADQRDSPIDILLMDIMLPDSWGTQLAQNIRVLHPEVGVIYTSGYAADDPIMMSGIDENTRFLHKPFELDQLLAEVAEMIEERATSV